MKAEQKKESRQNEESFHRHLKDAMDGQLNGQKEKLNQHIKEKDCAGAWKLWSETIERAFVEVCFWRSREKREEARYTGRGKANLKQVKVIQKEVHHVEEDTYIGEVDAETGRLRAQQRRCTQHAMRLKGSTLETSRMQKGKAWKS